MVLRAQQGKTSQPSIDFFVGLEKETARELEKLVAESDAPNLEALFQGLLVFGLKVLVDKINDTTEREKLDSLLKQAKVHLIEHDTEVEEAEARPPTLDELMEMSPEARGAYLERAAALLEDEYRNNPELTISADATELYDYPTPKPSIKRGDIWLVEFDPA